MPDMTGERGYARFARAARAVARTHEKPEATDEELLADWHDMDPELRRTWSKLDDIADQRLALGLDQPATPAAAPQPADRQLTHRAVYLRVLPTSSDDEKPGDIVAWYAPSVDITQPLDLTAEHWRPIYKPFPTPEEQRRIDRRERMARRHQAQQEAGQ